KLLMCYNKVPNGRQCRWAAQGARSDITELGLKSASILCLDSRIRILRLARLYLTVCWASCIVSVSTSKTQPCYSKLLRMVGPLHNNTTEYFYSNNCCRSEYEQSGSL